MVTVAVPVNQCGNHTGKRADIQNKPFTAVVFMFKPVPGRQDGIDDIEKADGIDCISERAENNLVVFINADSNRREERRTVYQQVEEKRDLEIAGFVFLWINNQGNAQRRNRPCRIACNNKDQPPQAAFRILLCPDDKTVRDNQDNRADNRHPVNPEFFLPCTPLPPEVHGKAYNQKDRNEMLFKQIGHSPILPFPRHPDPLLRTG